MKNIYYILITCFILFGNSCKEDFINLHDPSRHTTGTFWKTAEDAQAAINACYQALYYDGMYKRLYNWNMDVRADDVISTTPWWTQDVSLYKMTIDNPCYIATWEAAYKGVWRCNQLLDNIPGISMNETRKKIIIGQAKFMRGLYYYHLAITWENIPIILHTPQSFDDYYPANSKGVDVWAQVCKDFEDAMADLPINDFSGKPDGYGANDIGRATKGAAAAYLAKSLMISQKFNSPADKLVWEEAATILKDIIDQKYGSYSLIANYRQNFTKELQNNRESLFEVQFDDTGVSGSNLDNSWSGEPALDNTKTSGKAKTYAPLPGFGWGDVTPSNWIYEEFLKEKTVDGKNDPRMDASLFYKHFLKDKNGNDSIEDPNYKVYGKTWTEANLTLRTDYQVKQIYNVHIRKYLNDETQSNENDWRSGIHERIMRYADVVLLYAETQNELDNRAECANYLKLVRDRANLPDRTTEFSGFTKAQMRDQIAHERALEFCFEAQRYVDILRWGWFKDGVADANGKAYIDVLKEHDPEFGNWKPGREVFGIRQDELNSNKNLVQNPGWE